MSDSDIECTCGDDDGSEVTVMVMHAPTEPFTAYDLAGHLVLGAASTIGAVANMLGAISNDLFSAGRHQRAIAEAEAEEAENIRALVRTQIEIDSIPTYDPREG